MFVVCVLFFGVERWHIIFGLLLLCASICAFFVKKQRGFLSFLLLVLSAKNVAEGNTKPKVLLFFFQQNNLKKNTTEENQVCRVRKGSGKKMNAIVECFQQAKAIYVELVIIFLVVLCLSIPATAQPNLQKTIFGADHEYSYLGLFNGLQGISSVIFAPVLGSLADVYGRRGPLMFTFALLAVPTVLMVIAMELYGNVDDAYWFYVSAASALSVYGSSYALALASVTDHFKRRGSGYGRSSSSSAGKLSLPQQQQQHSGGINNEGEVSSAVTAPTSSTTADAATAVVDNNNNNNNNNNSDEESDEDRAASMKRQNIFSLCVFAFTMGIVLGSGIGTAIDDLKTKFWVQLGLRCAAPLWTFFLFKDDDAMGKSSRSETEDGSGNGDDDHGASSPPPPARISGGAGGDGRAASFPSSRGSMETVGGGAGANNNKDTTRDASERDDERQPLLTSSSSQHHHHHHHHHSPPEGAAGAVIETRDRIKKMLQNRPLLLACFITFMDFLAEQMLQALLLLYLHQQLKFTDEQQQHVLYAMGGSIAFTLLVLTRVFSRYFSVVTTMRFGLLVNAVAVALIGFIKKPWQSIALPIFGSLGALFFPTTTTYVSCIVDDEDAGVAQGFLSGARFFAEGCSPALFGVFLQRMKDTSFPGAPFVVAGACVLVAFALSYFLPQTGGRRMAAAAVAAN